jgi:hypothetical protein
MKARQVRRAESLSKKCMELAVAVPQVVAHRATRMALAGPLMSERDRKELQRMVSEKQAAFAQAYWAMGLQMFRVNLQLSRALFSALFSPFSLTAPSMVSVMAQAQHAARAAIGKGLTPIHRTAVSNARRLSKVALG